VLCCAHRVGYYTRRAFAYERLDNFEAALSDLRMALSMPPVPPMSRAEKQASSAGGAAFDQRSAILLSLARTHQKLNQLNQAIEYATIGLQEDAKQEKLIM
jgi:hypothetical protein